MIKQGDNEFQPKTSLRGGQSPTRQSLSVTRRLPRFARNDDNVTILNNQNGGAIVWVLVMIALFAALNYAVSIGSRSGGATISKEQAAIAATEIIDYARAIRQAVHILQINGCSDTEISLENPIVAGYEHTPPARDECKVFHPSGGGLSYRAPEDEWLDNSQSSLSHFSTWFTSSHTWVSGLGTDGVGSQCAGGSTDGSCRELMTGIPFIRREVCLEINKKLSWGADDAGTPFQDTAHSFGSSTHTNFTGNYSNGNQMGSATPSDYSNIMAGCIEGDVDPTSGTYHFFQVLIVR